MAQVDGTAAVSGLLRIKKAARCAAFFFDPVQRELLSDVAPPALNAGLEWSLFCPGFGKSVGVLTGTSGAGSGGGGSVAGTGSPGFINVGCGASVSFSSFLPQAPTNATAIIINNRYFFMSSLIRWIGGPCTAPSGLAMRNNHRINQSIIPFVIEQRRSGRIPKQTAAAGHCSAETHKTRHCQTFLRAARQPVSSRVQSHPPKPKHVQRQL